MSNRQMLTWSAFLAAAALVAATGWQLGARALASRSPSSVDVDVTYQTLSFDQMARGADLIVSGEVLGVSPTRWNQDDGSWWEETYEDSLGIQTADSALPYYEVTVRADRALVDGLGLAAAPGAETVFTVVGMSPVDAPAASGAMVLSETSEATAIPLTGPVLVFARRAPLAWRGGGTRDILQPLGSPAAAIRPIGQPAPGAEPMAADSLDALAAAVAAARSADGDGATE